MSLLEKWEDMASKERTEKEHNQFWKEYFEEEKNAYEYILENKKNIIEGKVTEIAEMLNLDVVKACGFLSGINTSLVNSLNLEEVSEDSDVKLEIDFEKLYYNMLDAKANWLYSLPQWDDILNEEKRLEITKNYKKDTIAVSDKIGRNEPCTCGSNKKYKKCCGK